MIFMEMGNQGKTIEDHLETQLPKDVTLVTVFPKVKICQVTKEV